MTAKSSSWPAGARDTGRTVWTAGVAALLPRADLLVFARPDGEGAPQVVAELSWERATTLLGDRLRGAPGHYPERFRTGEFPSDDELRAAAEGDPG